MKKRTDELINELKNSKSIKCFIDENESNFTDYSLSEYIEKLMKEKQLKKIDIVKRSNLSEVYTYQIMAGMKNPDREKLLCIIFALQLSMEEANRLLKIAGKAELYPRSKRDSILIFALERKLTINEANEMLFELSQETLV